MGGGWKNSHTQAQIPFQKNENKYARFHRVVFEKINRSARLSGGLPYN